MTTILEVGHDVNNVNSGGGSNHMRDQAMVLRNEIAELRQSLLRAQEKEQEIEYERNFYRVKVSELTEILELKGGQETSKLVAKSMQNAELVMQVDRLKRDLEVYTSTVQKMGEQRDNHKRMLLELSGIVVALQSVQVEYHGKQHNGQNTSSCLENIKAKVETIMEDRHVLVLRCKELEKAVDEKDRKIAALETQFHVLNSMNAAREVNMLQNSPEGNSHRPIITRSHSVGSQTDKNSMTSHSLAISLDANATRSITEDKQLSKDDISCGTATSATASSVSVWNDVSPTMSSDLSAQQQDEAEVHRLRLSLAEANQRYLHFKQVCQAAFAKMKDVEVEFNQVKQECKAAYFKRDKMRDNLKEVIDQYKSLHQEYDHTTDYLEGAKSKIKALEKAIEKLQDEKEHLGECGLENLEVEGLAGDVKKLGAAYLKAQRTIKSLREKLDSAERDAEQAQKRESNGGRKCRDAVADCRRLQYEKKILESRITDAEEQLQAAKKEMQKYKEEAKHTRHRLTSYMRKEGIPLHSSLPSNVFEASLMIPQLENFNK